MIDAAIVELTGLLGSVRAACVAAGQPQASHYRRHRQSARETFVKWKPVASANCRPVRPASRRISRRRLPNPSRARRSLRGHVRSAGSVLVVRGAQPPSSFERLSAQLDVVRVGTGGEVDVQAVAGVVMEDHQVVEHGEVVAGERH